MEKWQFHAISPRNMGIGIPQIGSKKKFYNPHRAHISSKQVGLFQQNLMGGIKHIHDASDAHPVKMSWNADHRPRGPLEIYESLVARTQGHFMGAHVRRIFIGDGGTPAFCELIQCEGTIMNHWMIDGEPYISNQSCPKCITCVFQHFGDQYRSTRLRKITHVFARDMVVSGPFLHNKNTCDKNRPATGWIIFFTD